VAQLAEERECLLMGLQRGGGLALSLFDEADVALGARPAVAVGHLWGLLAGHPDP
jgi:hypothetical protein